MPESKPRAQNLDSIGRLLVWVTVCLALGLPCSAADEAAKPGTISGRVLDETGAVIPAATVLVRIPRSDTRTTTADSLGAYEVSGLAPGRYSVHAVAQGYVPYEQVWVEIEAGAGQTIDLPLRVSFEKQELTVEDESSEGISVDPQSNVGAIILRGADLDALSDDPDDLAADLQALAGPSAGPSGGQIFVDGFSGARLPPKHSIREIRINSDPFSAQYDQLGFGRIEVFTKPGSDKFRGNTFLTFSDESLNSRNPFAPNRAPYQSRLYGGDLSGPINKKSSFFFDFERREIDDNAVINATVLDPSLSIVPFSLAVVTPQRRTSVGPRLDYQLGQKHTLVMRYRHFRDDLDDRGVGQFSLPSLAYDTLRSGHTVQVTETAVLSAETVNETRLQFRRNRFDRLGDNSIPTTNVLQAFQDGGAQVGLSENTVDSWEIQNYTTRSLGAHTLKFGGRLRTASVSDLSPQNFGGTFTFGGGFAPELDTNNQVVVDASGQPVMIPITSVERYRRTVLFEQQGLTGEQIRSLGGGATQFSIAGGNPDADVNQMDLGVFLLDDWRARPNLSLSLGLRYEIQTNISQGTNFAPRIGLAWAPRAGTSGRGKTVIRGGFGMFYDRVSEDLTLQSLRFNGLTQQQYIVRNPDFYPFVPSTDTLASLLAPQTIRRLAADGRAPYLIQTAIGIERQLPRRTTVAATYTHTRGVNLLRSRNINAPLPGTGERPFGRDDLFQFETTGFMRQNQLIANIRTRFHSRVSLFGFYSLNKAKSDTDGVGSFPANQYDLSTEYGRSALDIRHRFGMGGSITGPGGLRFSPFIILRSGVPFNITTGGDNNADLMFTDRPALATDLNDPNVIATRFGVFDPIPEPGTPVIARNFGEGPSYSRVSFRISRTFGFGKKVAASPDASGDRRPGEGIMIGGRRRGRRGGRYSRGRGGPFGGGSSEQSYSLTFSISVRNLFNTTNPAAPIGNLTSELFGQSNASAGFGWRGSSGAGNRTVRLQMRFGF